MIGDAIKLSVGEVSNFEARVYARYDAPLDDAPTDSGPTESAADEQQRIELRGTLRGPYCERAHTLPAEYEFHDLGPDRPGIAEAIVPDPCQWSAELPHLYHAEVEALRGDEVVARFRGPIGLRRGPAQKKTEFQSGQS